MTFVFFVLVDGNFVKAKWMDKLFIRLAYHFSSYKKIYKYINDEKGKVVRARIQHQKRWSQIRVWQSEKCEKVGKLNTWYEITQLDISLSNHLILPSCFPTKSITIFILFFFYFLIKRRMKWKIIMFTYNRDKGTKKKRWNDQTIQSLNPTMPA